MKVNLETIHSTRDKTIICKIDLKGTVDSNNIQDFDFIIYSLIEGGVRKLILDIEGLQYVDSTGIGAFIRIIKKLRAEKGEAVITRYNQQILNIIKPINMEKFVKFFPNIKDGISYLETI